MKKQLLIPLVLVAAIGLIFATQQFQEESIVINVEVPTRIFDGNTFVDTLTINDFELYEDGKLQKIEAVYLIKKKSIERREENKRFNPMTSRQFFLWFQISDYMPRIKEAIDYFFENVFIPGDSLVVVTPLKAYNLKSEALALRSVEEISDQLTKLIREDSVSGNLEYRAALRDLQEIVNVMEYKAGEREDSTQIGDEILSDFSIFNTGSLEEIVQMYSVVMRNLENLRKMDQQKLIDYAEYLKDKEGQKHIFLFYQREFLPRIDPNTLTEYMAQYQDKPALQFELNQLFENYDREIPIDVNKVKQAFADSSLSIHFLFLQEMSEMSPGLKMQERSEDIYGVFKQMADATGGVSESSGNPGWAFKRIADAFENYYLLYYSPENYAKDGKFKEIRVRVKTGNYRITHRAGYIAN
jgi:hypothetical protein